MQSSIQLVFDMSPETYGGFDLVYLWGVLHHTGNMYRALTVAASLVEPGGVLMVALYKKTPFCGMWRVIKRWYSAATPQSHQRAMRLRIMLQRLSLKLSGRDFDPYFSSYGEKRVMDFYNDVHDWMGGYPYESITSEKCCAFFAQLGFRLERKFVQTRSHPFSGLLGSGCDEFVFKRV